MKAVNKYYLCGKIIDEVMEDAMYNIAEFANGRHYEIVEKHIMTPLFDVVVANVYWGSWDGIEDELSWED